MLTCRGDALRHQHPAVVGHRAIYRARRACPHPRLGAPIASNCAGPEGGAGRGGALKSVLGPALFLRSGLDFGRLRWSCVHYIVPCVLGGSCAALLHAARSRSTFWIEADPILPAGSLATFAVQTFDHYGNRRAAGTAEHLRGPPALRRWPHCTSASGADRPIARSSAANARSAA